MRLRARVSLCAVVGKSTMYDRLDYLPLLPLYRSARSHVVTIDVQYQGLNVRVQVARESESKSGKTIEGFRNSMEPWATSHKMDERLSRGLDDFRASDA